jgi:hypothetical protein
MATYLAEETQTHQEQGWNRTFTKYLLLPCDAGRSTAGLVPNLLLTFWIDRKKWLGFLNGLPLPAVGIDRASGPSA